MMLTTRKIYNIGTPDFFEPYKIFNCGQCFRFEPAGENAYEGVAYGKYVSVEKDAEGKVLL